MRLFIADDSILVRNIVKEIISADSEIVFCGEASNGADAVNRILSLKPDLAIMDIDMPIMNGLDATKKILSALPIPIMIFTNNEDPELPFKALDLGAVDFLRKPDFNTINQPGFTGNFIIKLKQLSRKAPIRFNSTAPTDFRQNSSSREKMAKSPENTIIDDFLLRHEKGNYRIVLAGASTGGPAALSSLLRSLPSPFPLPIIIVQHIETGFDRGFAEWLGNESSHKTVLAEHEMVPQAGFIYIAPTDLHLKFSNGKMILVDSEKILNQKPSVDLLFSSGAENFGPDLLAVLLTGMGSDGARGSLAVRKYGGICIVQDEASSLIYGMPKAAVEAGGASAILGLDEIPLLLKKLVRIKT